MVIPVPETEVMEESDSGGLGAQPPDAEKGLMTSLLNLSITPVLFVCELNS